MEPFVALMRRYVVDYTNRHDPSVCPEIMESDYTLRMGPHTVRGRNESYIPAAQAQFDQYPGLGLTVHDLVTNGDQLAMSFSEHGAALHRDGAVASWAGIGLYRWNGRKLVENFVEQDYLARRRQLGSGQPSRIDPPAPAPWDTAARAPNPDNEQSVRSWIADGLPGQLVTHNDGTDRPRLDISHTDVDFLFSAGDQVAFRVSSHGSYQGGLAEVGEARPRRAHHPVSRRARTGGTRPCHRGPDHRGSARPPAKLAGHPADRGRMSAKRDQNGVVVAGAGLAGLTTATSLRAHGYRGPITLVGAEPHEPYDRPPLSKELLAGSSEITTLPANWDALDIRRQFGCTAQGLRDGRLVTTDGQIAYDSLVVATGSRPLNVPVHSSRRMYLVRTAEAVTCLRESLSAGTSTVVIGAGWLGAEIASTASARRCDVPVVEAGTAPLANLLGSAVSSAFTRWYAAAGIRLICGSPVTNVQDDTVTLADGSRLVADVVVVAIGAAPDTTWLDDAIELDATGGVVVNRFLQASRPGVYAVGDCASYPSQRYAKPMRVEHWSNAQQSAMVVAKTILGEEGAYDPVPYFWSKQFGHMVQYIGQHEAGDDLEWRGQPEDQRWSVCWRRREELTAVLAVDRPRDIVDARRALRAGTGRDQ